VREAILVKSDNLLRAVDALCRGDADIRTAAGQGNVEAGEKAAHVVALLGSYCFRQGTHHLDHGEDRAWFTPPD